MLWPVVAGLVLLGCSEGSVADLEASFGAPTSTTTVAPTDTERPADGESPADTEAPPTTGQPPDTEPPASSAGGGEASVFLLEVGDCFDEPDITAAVSDVPIVPCDQPHDNEVYAIYDLADGDYPGQDAVETSALDGCLERFEPFVGRDYATSALDYFHLTPTVESWSAGDREVICSVYRVDLEKMTGSMQGSGI